MNLFDSSLPKPHTSPAVIHTITAATGANIEWVIFALVALIVVGVFAFEVGRQRKAGA